MMRDDLHALTQTIAFKVADAAVAAGAVTYPFWRQALHDFSAIAADVTPIFGVLWLGVQITCKVTNICGGRRG